MGKRTIARKPIFGKLLIIWLKVENTPFIGEKINSCHCEGTEAIYNILS
jgi:hypothetical protein